MRNRWARAIVACAAGGVAGLVSAIAAHAQTLPIGGQVTAGQAIIQAPVGGSLVIDQASTNAIVQWQNFSIGGSGSVAFNNGNGATLNRVTGPSLSQIDGLLAATGSVFLINPNGVVIGPNGVVETGGSFVASTLNVLDDDFLDGGDLRFFGENQAEVVNLGKISSLGGDVALIGLTVRNEGDLSATNGTAALIAGREILMRDSDVGDGKFMVSVADGGAKVSHTGAIEAATAELRANGGNVYALAGNRGGAINATGVTRQGGRVFLTAPGGSVKLTQPVTVKRPRHDGSPAIDGGEVIIEADAVSLGSDVTADGERGGAVTIKAGSLSLAETVSARGKEGAGGSVDIDVWDNTLATSTALIDVSGLQGGSIRHVSGKDLLTSGRYLAIGTDGPGGTIDVTAGAIRLLSATIDASGKSGGGRIRIGGEFQGGKGLLLDELPNALRLAITDTTLIRAASTGPSGNGGEIILWADERAAVLGEIDARPGEQDGAGGFVEISSSGELTYRATVDASRAGRAGTVLIDPTSIIIADVAFNQLVFILGSGFSFPDIGGVLDNGDKFGRSVSLNGNRLAVGALGDDGQGNAATNTGAVYLFTFTDANFSGGSLAAIIGEGYVGGKNIDLSATLDDTDEFGRTVSLDANRLAVGTLNDDGAGNAANNTGAVYLFSFTDGAFNGGTLEATIGQGYGGAKDIDLTGLVDSTDNFGQFVSLDDTRLAIGAPVDDGPGAGGGANFGAIYLITFTDQAFSGGTLQAVIGNGYNARPKDLDLSPFLGPEDVFGNGVSLDGQRLAAGRSFSDEGGFDTGSVFLFSFTDLLFSGATLEARIGAGFAGAKDIDIGADLDPIDLFGAEVSLSGNRLAVGATGDDGLGLSGTSNFTGAVYLFTFADAAFNGGQLVGKIGSGYTGGKNVDLSSNLDAGDAFGVSVSLDGNRLAVGAFEDDGQGNTTTNAGAVYLFSFTDAVFSGGQLEAVIGEGFGGGKNIDLWANLDNSDLFGASVSLDGNRLAVGARTDGGFANGAPNTGAVYLFSFTDADFTGTTLEGVIGEGYAGGKNIDQPLDAGDLFGVSVSLDGTRLAVGAQNDAGLGNAFGANGAVYLYTFVDASFGGGTLAGIVGQGYAGARDVNQTLNFDANFGGSVSLDGNRIAIGTISDDGFGGVANNSGAVRLYTFADNLFNGGQLVATIGVGYAALGGKNISGPNETGDNFGYLSLDRLRLAVGSPGDDGFNNSGGFVGGLGRGAVFLFSFTDLNFSGGVLQASIGVNYSNGKDIDVPLDLPDFFGTSVSLNGNRLAIGATNDGGNANSAPGTGAIYLFTFVDNVFSGGILHGIIGSGYAGGNNIDAGALIDDQDGFGIGVSLDGSRLAVGAMGDDGQGNIASDTGAVYLFTNVFGAAGAGDPVTDGLFGTRIGDTITITPAALLALLNAGNNVVLQANSDITVRAPIIVNNPAGNGGTLTFQAGRSFAAEADIFTDGGNLLVFANETQANGVVDADRQPGTATVVILPGVTINTGFGTLLIELRDGAGNSNTSAGNISFGTGSALVANSVSINNAGGEPDNAVVFDAGTTVTTSGAGISVVITSDVFTNNSGVGLFTFVGGGQAKITTTPQGGVPMVPSLGAGTGGPTQQQIAQATTESQGPVELNAQPRPIGLALNANDQHSGVRGLSAGGAEAGGDTITIGLFSFVLPDNDNACGDNPDYAVLCQNVPAIAFDYLN